MSFSERIESINNKLKPYHSFMLMMIFFVTSIWAIGRFFFKAPDLEVIVHKDKINYPASISEQSDKVFHYIIDSLKNPELTITTNDIINYLLKTKELMTLEIYNNTNSTLKSVQIKVPNVVDVTSKAISSSYLSSQEYNNLLSNLIYDESNSLVTINNTIDIPPKENLKIYLWGEFSDSDEEDIIAYYGNGTGDIFYPKSFTGWRAFVADYFIEIFLFILLTITIAYILQPKRHVDN